MRTAMPQSVLFSAANDTPESEKDKGALIVVTLDLTLQHFPVKYFNTKITA